MGWKEEREMMFSGRPSGSEEASILGAPRTQSGLPLSENQGWEGIKAEVT